MMSGFPDPNQGLGGQHHHDGHMVRRFRALWRFKIVQISERTIGSGARVFWMFALSPYSRHLQRKDAPEAKGWDIEISPRTGWKKG